MTKAAKIREALGAVAPGGLTLQQLADKTGITKLLSENLGAFTQRGEVTAKPDGEGLVRYHINRNYTKGGGTRATRKGKSSRQPRTGSGAAGKKAVKRPYKRLADKAAQRNSAGLPALALDNYIGAGALLRQAIEDGVEDLEAAIGLRNASPTTTAPRKSSLRRNADDQCGERGQAASG